MHAILWLTKATEEDAALVGIKALNLAKTLQAGFCEPHGFAFTTTVYEHDLVANELQAAVLSLQSRPTAQAQLAARLQEGILAGRISADARSAILDACRQLTTGTEADPSAAALQGNWFDTPMSLQYNPM